MFNTPILLITFNRPNHTRQVFEAIKQQRPKQLFVFQDGARQGNAADIEKCKEVRAIFKEPLDWECELHTNFSKVNLGCGPGPASGITWFFEQVEQGIIFEDDAVPAPDFFGYAEELLERYKNNHTIKVIGSMHLDGKNYGNVSYHFTMGNRNLCAWATWKRTWRDFDYYMKEVSIDNFKSSLNKYHTSNKEIDFWCSRLNEIHKDCLGHSSWDMQFVMSIWLKQGIGIFPNINLSTNIGFDDEGTHTISKNNPAANLDVGNILPLVHPVNIKINRKADLNYHKLYFQPEEYGWSGIKRLPFRINKKLKRLLGIKGSWIKK